MYQALSRLTVLQATGSWARAWERGYRTSKQQDRTATQQNRTATQQDRTPTQQDRTAIQQDNHIAGHLCLPWQTIWSRLLCQRKRLGSQQDLPTPAHTHTQQTGCNNFSCMYATCMCIAFVLLHTICQVKTKKKVNKTTMHKEYWPSELVGDPTTVVHLSKRTWREETDVHSSALMSYTNNMIM